MGNWELKLIQAEVERLLRLATDDEAIRDTLRDLANSILEATDGPRPSETGPEVPRETSSDPEPLHELTLGRVPPGEAHSAPRLGGPPRLSARQELEQLADRCTLKAEAARRAAERVVDRASSVEVVDEAGVAPEVRSWTRRFEDAFYWSVRDEGAAAPDPIRLEELAGSYDALGAALRLVLAAPDDARRLAVSLPLLAEAQSSVRVAHHRLGPSDDPDQTSAFEWLRDAAARHRIYLSRFMRIDDQADPSAWSDRLERIEDVASRRGGVGHAARVDTLLARLRAVLDPDGDKTIPDWDEVARVVDQIIACGIAPSAPDLRRLLLPRLDEIPSERNGPPGFLRTLREIDRYLATRRPIDLASGPPEWSPAVATVAERLEGRSLLLIGGQRRRDAQAALVSAFRIASLVWVTTKEHQSIATFEPAVARPEIALVLLAIRWSSHGFGAVKSLCDGHGKPLVRLPGGYGVNQIAEQILSQAGGRLGP